MATKFLQEYDVKTLMMAPLEMKYIEDVWSPLIMTPLEKKYNEDVGAARRIPFEGSLLEVLMLYHDYGGRRLEPDPFKESAAQGITALFFLTCVSSHHLSYELDYIKHSCSGKKGFPCPLKTLSENGYDPNALDIPVTPLQMAVYRWDFPATRLLLDNGAQVNALGNRDLEVPPHLDYDTRWNACSPLHIIRNSTRGLKGRPSVYEGDRDRSSNRPGIERLLLKRGAEDFVVDKSGTRVHKELRNR
jgi:hypothetical protein